MKIIETDFLIIGSGLAGQTYAMNVCKYGKTVLICKSHLPDTNTFYAQGGIACVLSDQDDLELHVQDTLKAGDGLCNEEAVRFMVSKAPQAIMELEEQGVEFTKNKGRFELGLEGGHSRNRIVHARDQTGKEVQISLLKKILNEDIDIYEHHLAFELLVQDSICRGVYVLNLVNNEILCFYSSKIFLATGGAGQLYLHTTNPEIATGDGIALAYNAGASISDMEFIQFHPTALYTPGKKTFLISEAVRGFGGELKNKEGKSFMKEYHPLGSLAPRDSVARAIVTEMEKTGESCVWLDLRDTDLKKASETFPNIFKTCLERGVDPFKEMIPVTPAAHYVCGGVATDLNGRTTIPGLFAAGEVARTGIHGANRLASNSLLEALIFSKAAAMASINEVSVYSYNPVDLKPFKVKRELYTGGLRIKIQKLMWEYAGIKRNMEGLFFCLEQLSGMERQVEQIAGQMEINKELSEIRNMLTVSKLILIAAKERKESRGGHFIERVGMKNLISRTPSKSFK